MANLLLRMAYCVRIRNVALLLILLVALLFFFHATAGSYQAMHGPTSTLKEVQFPILLQAMVVLLTCGFLAFHFKMIAGAFHAFAEAWAPPLDSAALSPLRC